MQAHLQSDPSRGAGYGIIDLEGFAGQDVDVLFALRRASDHKYLGSGGWLEAEQRLAPDMPQRHDDVLRLLVGPAVVDMVDALDTYAITIYSAVGGNKLDESCGLEIGNLIYSTLAGGQGVGRQASAPPPLPERPAPAPKPQPAPAPEPLPEPQPVPAPPPGPESALPPPKPLPSPAPEPELPALKDPVKPKSKAPLFFLLLLALAVAAAGIYWKMSAGAPSASTGASAGASAGTPAGSSAQKARAASQSPPAVQRAREALRRGVSAEEAAALAKELHTPDGADGAFLLLEEAAQKGAPEAMLSLARFYDPTDALPKGSILPDPEQAREWYVKARDKGQSAAEDRLKALRAWAEANKDKDPHAQKLLEIWK